MPPKKPLRPTKTKKPRSHAHRAIPKPQPGEYPAYATMYLELLPPDVEILKHLDASLKSNTKFLNSIPKSKLMHRYAEGKWTIKEVIGHLIDDERVYVYRALRFARNDSTELPGFDQDPYAAHSNANHRDLKNLLAEYAAVRASTLAFFNSLDDAALIRSGIANGNRSSVRSYPFHIAGHELHHINLIKQRYLK
jgi:uncharacterized damage-inducible protein DinB